LSLRDDVELTAFVELAGHVARGFEAGAELALGLAHALGDGAQLAVPLGEQHDDAISLPQPVRAQHDRLVAVEAHDCSIPPKRRSRDWYSRTASNRCSRRKSGHSTSVNTSSLYAICHSR